MTTADRPDNLESVMRRVQKLLAIAGDDRANPAEAAAAAAQAERIMRKFQIEHADITMAELKRADSFAEELVGTSMDPDAKSRTVTTWSTWLAGAIGKLHDCRPFAGWTANLERCIGYQGFAADAKVARWTHIYIVNALARACKDYGAQLGAVPGKRSKMESFRRGFILAVVQALEKAYELKRAETAAGESRALVVVKAEAVQQHFGDMRKGRKREDEKPRTASFFDGVREGKKLDVNARAVESSAGVSQLALGR